MTNQCKITVQIIPEEGNLRRKDVRNNALIRAKNKEKKQKQNDKIKASERRIIAYYSGGKRRQKEI
jgi:hypothetical protein